MDEKYTDAYIDSAKFYLYKLSYLAKQDPGTLKDLSLLEIILQIYNWADWFVVSENDKIKIQKLLDCIYFRNPNLVLPKVIPGIFYSNVSTPQTIWTWQRIWDNLNVHETVGPNPQAAFLTVNPNSKTVSSLTGTTSFTVTSNVEWTVTSSQPWCTVVKNSSGLFTVSFSTNILSSTRSATLLVSGPGVTSVNVILLQEAAGAILTVTPKENVVSALLGATIYSVVTNGNWTAVSDSAWCSVTPSGTGNGTIFANYAANIGDVPRSALITVTTPGLQPIIVRLAQQAASTYLTVTPSTRAVIASGGTANFTISSNTTWTTAVSGIGSSWCTATLSGANNGTVVATCTPNLNMGNRSATITISAANITPLTVTVNQAGAAGYLSITPSQITTSNAAGSVSFAVDSNVAWTTSSDATWCTFTPSGIGIGAVVVNFGANTIPTERSAIISISAPGLGPYKVTVYQSAASGFLPTEIHQGYIYNWNVLTSSDPISSSDDWVLPRISIVESLNPTAEYLRLKAFANPDFDQLLHDQTNDFGFNAYNTFGRLESGVFTTNANYPTGSILMSPYNTAATKGAIFIGMNGTNPTMEVYNIGNTSFPIRLVKTSTTLLPGETGVYVGNNGREYPTICIGNPDDCQEWLAVNLIETNFRNGSEIPEIINNLDWNAAINANTPARCSYDNDETNAFIIYDV